MTVVLEGGSADQKAHVEVQSAENAPPPKKRRDRLMKPRKTRNKKDVARFDEYEDKADEAPHQAASSVLREAMENTKHAMRGSSLARFTRKPKPANIDQPVQAEPVAAPGPVLFDNDLLKKERELRQEIKDDFTDTAA